ncbi:sugar ABC transporter ATP-binding protein [Colwellia echini]|uniref:Sugar ABC transporter ATP-binding protein n=1 Tax=Colwellia echini TaxID=1982103 RepID=A0ABY3N160_9GAMM|nr:sugar ABC transporter ATP-binding protein [Colwellia echini]TYK67230.1 sugar ABC transporter ATP-binding protein [Colwellia echini]
MNWDSPILQVTGISKSFNNIPALNSIDLSLNPGEVRALIGQNGAGKSTLIKILNGAYTLDSGSILFDNKQVQYSSPYQAQLDGMSTIFQEVNLLGYRTVAENIMAGREIKRYGLIDWAACNKFADEAVKILGLDIDVTRTLDSFNVAIQQLIAIARSVSFNAKVLIMDEPTASLDEAEKKTLFKVVKDLKTQGVAILYVSHHLEELFEICDSVSVMRDGRMIETSLIKDLTKKDMVAKMLGKRVEDILSDENARPKVCANDEVILHVEKISGSGVLKEVTFELKKGEILGLAGLLGSGRSEVAKRIFGAEQDDSYQGKISINDITIGVNGPKIAIEKGIAFCSEDRKNEGIIPEMSVRENMSLVILDSLSKNGLIDKEKEMALVDSYIKKLGIKVSDMEQPISQLSGGNQQKVLLARWMANNPEVLILDEPTRGIDVGAKSEITDLILSLAEQGLSVLFISSEYEEISASCHKVLVMQEGISRDYLHYDEISENAILDELGKH